jgi:hypothetical protein
MTGLDKRGVDVLVASPGDAGTVRRRPADRDSDTSHPHSLRIGYTSPPIPRRRMVPHDSDGVPDEQVGTGGD